MKKLVTIAVVLSLWTLSVFAQGSGKVPSGGSSSNSSVMRELEGSIQKVDHTELYVVIQTEDGRQLRFGIDAKKTKLKADKKTSLAKEKRKLNVADLTEQQRIRVTYDATAPANATIIKILETPPASVEKVKSEAS